MPENATTNESNHVTLILRELSDDEKMKYITEMREKALHDEATAMNAAEKRGMEKARAEGLAEGREEGRKARKAEIAEKMVQGRIGKFYEEICLVDQAFVKEPSKKVSQLLSEKDAEVVAFARFEKGEGIEKKEENFAEEVMKQLK